MAAVAVEGMVSRALNVGGRIALYASGGILCIGAYKAYNYMHSNKTAANSKKHPSKKQKSWWLFKHR